MKSFFKVLLLVVLALLIAQAVPIVGIPAGIGLGALGAAAAFLFLCVGGLLAGALGVLAGVLAVLLVVLAVLSPIWLPIMLIVGIVCLCRRGKRAAKTTEAVPTITPSVV